MREVFNTNRYNVMDLTQELHKSYFTQCSQRPSWVIPDTPGEIKAQGGSRIGFRSQLVATEV